jgi:hypothetical protein
MKKKTIKKKVIRNYSVNFNKNFVFIKRNLLIYIFVID